MGQMPNRQGNFAIASLGGDESGPVTGGHKSSSSSSNVLTKAVRNRWCGRPDSFGNWDRRRRRGNGRAFGGYMIVHRESCAGSE